jgi:hypothetical protein
MAGNVWEWVQSEYKDYPYHADDGREENLDSTDVLRVLRGGSWDDNENNARASNRNNNNPNNQNDNIGFRCVAAAPGVVSASQVQRVHGCDASAPGEHSRPGPGWGAIANSTKDSLPPFRPVGWCREPGRWQIELLNALRVFSRLSASGGEGFKYESLVLLAVSTSCQRIANE